MRSRRAPPPVPTEGPPLGWGGGRGGGIAGGPGFSPSVLSRPSCLLCHPGFPKPESGDRDHLTSWPHCPAGLPHLTSPLSSRIFRGFLPAVILGMSSWGVPPGRTPQQDGWRRRGGPGPAAPPALRLSTPQGPAPAPYPFPAAPTAPTLASNGNLCLLWKDLTGHVLYVPWILATWVHGCGMRILCRRPCVSRYARPCPSAQDTLGSLQ